MSIHTYGFYGGYRKKGFANIFTGIRLADKPQTLNMWTTLVENYSESMLTRHTDRLVAISALASFFNVLLNLGDSSDGLGSSSTYLAGLWGFDLIPQMLWRVLQLRSLPSECSYIAPSWSWASLDYAVYYSSNFLNRHEYVRLATVSASTTLTNPKEPFSEVKYGWILLFGKLLQVTWTCRGGCMKGQKSRDSGIIQIRVGETASSHPILDCEGLGWNVAPYDLEVPVPEEVFYLLPLICSQRSKLNQVVADVKLSELQDKCSKLGSSEENSTSNENKQWTSTFISGIVLKPSPWTGKSPLQQDPLVPSQFIRVGT